MRATVRISSTAHRSLAQMAEQTNSSLQETLDRAIENERRRLLLEQTKQAYAKLRQNKKSLEKVASGAATIGRHTRRRHLDGISAPRRNLARGSTLHAWSRANWPQTSARSLR